MLDIVHTLTLFELLMMLSHDKVNALMIVWSDVMSLLIMMMNDPGTDLSDTGENSTTHGTTTTMQLLQIFIRYILHVKNYTSIMYLNLHQPLTSFFYKATQLISGKPVMS